MAESNNRWEMDFRQDWMGNWEASRRVGLEIWVSNSVCCCLLDGHFWRDNMQFPLTLMLLDLPLLRELNPEWRV